MLTFWLLAAATLLLAYGLFWWHLRKPISPSSPTQINANLAVHHQRRQELEQELTEGKIGPAEFERLTTELDRELLDQLPEDNAANDAAATHYKGLSLVLASLAGLPVIAFALYLQLGRPDLVNGVQTRTQAAPPSLEAAVGRLNTRLAENPDDLEGWILLARTYQALGHPQKALQAYAKALKHNPEHPELKLRYAETLAQTQQGNLQGEPEKLIQQVLETHKDYPYALWLAGMAAIQKGDKPTAQQYWETLLKQMPPQSPAAKQLISMMERTGLQVPSQAAQAAQTAQATSEASITVNVSLAPELAQKAAPTDSLFVFARAAKGPPMPLAIVRKQVKDLPLTITLDDSMAMMPQMKLSKFDQVILGARIAKTGNAKGAPGDLEGWTQPVSVPHNKPVTILINQVRQ